MNVTGTVFTTSAFAYVSSCPFDCDTNFTCDDCNLESCWNYIYRNWTDYHDCTPKETIETVVVPSIWGALMLAGMLGNGLVVYVMLFHGEMNTTNCYILNLAFSDLAFTGVVIPLTMVHYVSTDWIFGSFLCKFHMYMIYVTMQATCLTLTAMTIDRYYAIVYPIKSLNHRTPRKVVCVNCCIWIVALVVNVPFAIYHGLVESFYFGPRLYCRETWPSVLWEKVAITHVVILTYVIPLGIILVCYSRMMKHLLKTESPGKGLVKPPLTTGSKLRNAMVSHQNAVSRSHCKKRRKASKMIAVVVILFSTLWLPIHIFQLWVRYDPNFPKINVTYIFKIVAHTLSYANSCCNPFVYSFLGDGFRKAIRRAFPRLLRRNEVTSLEIDVVNKITAREGRCTNATTILGIRDSERVATLQEPLATSTTNKCRQLSPNRFLPRPECACVTKHQLIVPLAANEKSNTLPSLIEMEMEHLQNNPLSPKGEF